MEHEIRLTWRYQEQKGWDKFKRCLEAAQSDRKNGGYTLKAHIYNLKIPVRKNSKSKNETGSRASRRAQ